MKKYDASGLSENEKNYLRECLDKYRVEKAKEKGLRQFYDKIIKINGFDVFGIFSSYCETGMEGRVDWVIIDERKKGIDALVHDLEGGDKITLLDNKGMIIREPIILDRASTVLREYYSMCDKLKIKLNNNDNAEYYVGLTKKR